MQDSGDIITCLNELGIAFYAEDLRRPTPPKVQYLFERFVGELMGVHKESVEPIIRAATDGREHADEQHESAMLMAFFSSLTQLMAQCGVPSFSFADVLRPEPERLKVILSHVINFLRFRATRVPRTDALLQRSEDTREAIDRLAYENDGLAARIGALRDGRARDAGAVEAARAGNRKLTDDLRAFKKKQTALTLELDKMKDEKKALTRSLLDCQYLIEANQRECANLQPYIVDSPEQLQQVLVDLNRALAKEREAVDGTERRMRAVATSTDSFGVIETDLANCVRLMEEAQKELAKQEEVERKQRRLKESLQQKETEVKEIKRKEEVSTGMRAVEDAADTASGSCGHSRAPTRSSRAAGSRRRRGERRPCTRWACSRPSTTRCRRSATRSTARLSSKTTGSSSRRKRSAPPASILHDISNVPRLPKSRPRWRRRSGWPRPSTTGSRRTSRST